MFGPSSALRLRILDMFNRTRYQRQASDPIGDNTYHLIWDLACWGVVVGFVVNFLSVYVVRLGASSVLISAVTYGPTLIVMLGQLPVTNLVRMTGRRMVWMKSSMLIARLFYVGIAVLPFFVTSGRAEITVLFIVLQAIPGTIAGVTFLAILVDSVPNDQLDELQRKRMAVFGLSITLSNLVASQVLLRVSFPLNYQLLFFGGFLAAMASLYHISKLQVQDYARMTKTDWNFFRVLSRTLRVPLFTIYIIAAAVFHVALGMLAPLIPIFLVRKLGGTDFQIGLLAIAGSTTVMISSLLIRRMSFRISPELLLAIAIGGHALYPLLYSISPTIQWIVPFAIFANIFVAIIGIHLFADLVKITPGGNRTEFIGVYILTINMSVFLGSLFAGFLARDLQYILPGMRLAAIINLTAAALFWLLQKKKQRPLIFEASEQQG